MSGSSCVPYNIGAVRLLGAGWPLKTWGSKNYLVLQFWSDCADFWLYLYNAPILKFSRAMFCNFRLEPKLWRHQWRNFRFCKSCRRAMRFSPLDSSDDFMRRCGLRFCLSLIVSELWRHNDVISTFAKVVVQRCGLYSRPWTIVA